MILAMSSHRETPLLEFIPYLFRRLTTELNGEIVRDLKPYNINLPRWRIIAVLHFCGGVNIGELASLTSLTQPGTSQIIDKLVTEKLVRRRSKKEDNRIMHIALTAAGERLFQDIFPIILQHQDHLTSDFTPEEKALFISLCQRMLVNIKR
ncbi:MAG: hypothetical protein COA81_02145 [Alphaproteobacteria bacterium]|nr:MAG: hypothetical protein COA81_02145 [Alphaproteobacteria bacterium]